MARKDYRSSKILVASASMMMLGGIATLVSLHGPYGNTGSAAGATDQEDAQRIVTYDLGDDDNEYYAGRYIQVPDSGPVAQSRGS